MLKRYQVLLNDWLGKHLQTIAKKYDISFSETIRWALCMHVEKSVYKAHPKLNHKSEGVHAKHVELVKERVNGKPMDEIKLHKFLSALYYETRKAIEYWDKEEKKVKRKP